MFRVILKQRGTKQNFLLKVGLVLRKIKNMLSIKSWTLFILTFKRNVALFLCIGNSLPDLVSRSDKFVLQNQPPLFSITHTWVKAYNADWKPTPPPFHPDPPYPHQTIWQRIPSPPLSPPYIPEQKNRFWACNRIIDFGFSYSSFAGWEGGFLTTSSCERTEQSEEIYIPGFSLDYFHRFLTIHQTIYWK